MFRRLRDRIESALDEMESKRGFRREDVEDLLRGMRSELIQAKADCTRLEQDVKKLIAVADRLTGEIKTAERRAGKAVAVGDDETARVGLEFAERARSRLEVQVMKVETAKADLLEQRAEVRRMTVQLKEATANKGGILARGQAAAARQQSLDAADAFDAFDRAAETIDDAAATDRARRELDEELGLGSQGSRAAGGGGAQTADPGLDEAWEKMDKGSRESRADQLLEELKRRMREEGDSP